MHFAFLQRDKRLLFSTTANLALPLMKLFSQDSGSQEKQTCRKKKMNHKLTSLRFVSVSSTEEWELYTGSLRQVTSTHLGGPSPTLDDAADTLSAVSSSLADTMVSVGFSSFLSDLPAGKTRTVLIMWRCYVLVAGGAFNKQRCSVFITLEGQSTKNKWSPSYTYRSDVCC